jgi:hypothetical protein
MILHTVMDHLSIFDNIHTQTKPSSLMKSIRSTEFVFLLGAVTIFQFDSIDSNLHVFSPPNAGINVIFKKWDPGNTFRCAKQYPIESQIAEYTNEILENVLRQL